MARMRPLSEEFRLVHRFGSVLAEQFDKLREAALFIGTEVVMNVPAQVVLAELEIELRSVRDAVVQRLQTERLGFTQNAPKVRRFDASAQRPHRINKRQFGEFRPGGPEV